MKTFGRVSLAVIGIIPLTATLGCLADYLHPIVREYLYQGGFIAYGVGLGLWLKK